MLCCLTNTLFTWFYLLFLWDRVVFQLRARLCKPDVVSRGPQRAACHTGVQRHG